LKKQNAPLAGILFFKMHNPLLPPPFFFVFPPNAWRLSRDKRKESLKRVFLDRRLNWYHADTHTALHHVDPYSNKSHVLEL
jgi:hypothetical protein